MRHVSIRTRFLSVTWPPLKLEVTFCVRGVISPALANWYMKRMWKGWRQTGRGGQYRSHIVNYADDFVILSRGKAKEALEWTHGVLQRLELVRICG